MLNYGSQRKIEPSLKPFIKGFLNVLLNVLLVVTTLSTIDLKMTSLAAIIGATSLAIGLALSGALQNSAGSIIILIFKPYKIGDIIEAQGFRGTVSEVHIFNKIIKSPDNKTIIIPNGKLSNSLMTNFSTEMTRRVDWIFGIAYGNDVDKARGIISRLANEDARILNEPPIFIVVSELGGSSVNMAVRA